MLTQKQLALFNRRDHKAYDVVFRFFYPDIYKYVCKKIKDETEAQDITMNVFIDLYKSPETFEHTVNIKAFLFRLTINRCLNFLKSKQRQRDIANRLMDQDNDTENNEPQMKYDMEAMAALTEIIKQLPGKYGQVARYMYFNDYTYQQIAELLNISLDMVYKLRDYAIKRIREQLRGI